MALPQKRALGALPGGASDEESAALAVQKMFNDIAPRYDFLNHVLSCNVDKLWWRRVAKMFSKILQEPSALVLDLCCGTGDMALALRRQARRENPLHHREPEGIGARIIALDFAHAMLERGAVKFAGKRISPVEADALRLPFAAEQFSLVVSAFGFRNLANYRAGLLEIGRVLSPGGQVGILDFSEPEGLMGTLYGFYFRRVLPAIGTFIAGVQGPYDYLPASVVRFPTPQEMVRQMEDAGFENVRWIPYTGGIAGLYLASRPHIG